MQPRVFCTLFDRNYLLRGLALLRSLQRHSPPFELHVLCMCDRTHELLSALRDPDLRLIRRADFEDDRLRAASATRSVAEYCWTCSSALMRWVMDRTTSDLVTYLDADMFFFDSPERVFEELGAASIGIHEHRFSPSLRHQEVYGRFNVGWVTFRRDAAGFACADDWRSRCLEWCHDRLEDGKYGDQAYLDAWPGRWGEAVRILRGKGVALAPWNTAQYEIRATPDGRVVVDGEPLIFFHFYKYRAYKDGGHVWCEFLPSRSSEVALIYRPYTRALKRCLEEVRRVAPGFSDGLGQRRLRGRIRMEVQQHGQRFLADRPWLARGVEALRRRWSRGRRSSP